MLNEMKMSEVFSNIGVQPDELSYEADDEFYELSDYDISTTDTFEGNDMEEAIYSQYITQIAEQYFRSISKNNKEISDYGDRMAH